MDSYMVESLKAIKTVKVPECPGYRKCIAPYALQEVLELSDLF